MTLACNFPFRQSSFNAVSALNYFHFESGVLHLLFEDYLACLKNFSQLTQEWCDDLITENVGSLLLPLRCAFLYDPSLSTMETPCHLSPPI